MNNTDPLAALKPMIAPAPVPWWPLAPGWWALAALLLLLVCVLAVWRYRRHSFLQRTRYRREALALLAAINNTQEGKQQLQTIASILRRAAICVWGREYAAIRPWRELLAPREKKSRACFDDATIQLLDEYQYRPQAPAEEALQKLHTQAADWLQQLPPLEHAP